jgi:hypothetical protein
VRLATFVTDQRREELSSANLESDQPLGVFIDDLDRVDLGPARSTTGEGHQLIDRPRLSLEHRLDRSVRAVSDPTRDARRVRPAPGGVAEEDALDATADYDPLAY